MMYMRSVATKLHGYDWFRSIGSPKFISAPMVEQSALPFRLLVRQNGADLAFTQMHHARNFLIDENYRNDCIDWNDYKHNDGDKIKEAMALQLEKHLIVQFCGNDPTTIVNAAKYVHNNVSAIDLNCGCPQKIAKRGNYGAYLLKNPDLIVSILETMVKNLNCPITVKIRKLENVEDTINLCKRLENAGVSMITLHARTVDSSKLYTGPADWDVIKQCKENVNIPLIANGGISCHDDVLKCLEYTKCDGVMSSEALLENPRLFTKEGDYKFKYDYINSQFDIVDQYIDLVKSYKLPQQYYLGVRSHLFKFLHRFTDCDTNEAERKMLAEGDFNDMVAVVERLKEKMKAVNNDPMLAVENNLISDTSWYYRHRREDRKSLITPRRRDRFTRIIDDEPIESKLESLKQRLKSKHGQ